MTPGPNESERSLEEIRSLRERLAGLERENATLRDSRDLFESFANYCPAAAYVKDVDDEGRYLYINKELERVFQRPASHFLGKTYDEVWPPETAHQLRKNDRAALDADQALEVMETLPHPDGEHCWMTLKFSFRTATGRRLLAGISVDVTERKRIEQERAELLERERTTRLEAELALAALQASEARFRRLVDANIIGVVFGDEERFLDANDVFLEMLGYNREELAEGRLRRSEITPPEYRRADEKAAEELRTRGACRPFEKEFFRKDGRRVPVLMGSAMLEGAHPFTCACFVLDLTGHKRLEERLRRSQYLESLGLLAGGLAHDFNNLLTAIIGNTSLAAADRSLSPLARTHLDEALAASEQAAELVRELLAYGGKGRFVLELVNLSEIVSETTSRAALPPKVELELGLAPDLPPIKADPGQIRRLVQSLLRNATEAIGESSGKVRMSTRTQRLEESHLSSTGDPLAPGAYVCLEVRDTGCGMDEQLQSRIFDPFFTTKLPGRGMGLAAVMGIARGHRGTIEVSSHPGAGTTFQVLLPAEEATGEEH